MTDGSFLVEWESCPPGDHDKPDAVWSPRRQEFERAADAIRHCDALRLSMGTRQVSIKPEPDWREYR